MTIDERKSRATPRSRAAALARLLNADRSLPKLLPFEVTLGDELQGVVADVWALVTVLRVVERQGAWWVGVGIGELGQLGPTARVSTGSVFIEARAAVERAKKLPWGVAIEAGGWKRAGDFERAIGLWTTLLQMRSPRGWETVDLRRQGLTEPQIAVKLGISQQAVNQRLRAAFFAQDEEGALLIQSISAEVRDQ